MTKKPKMANYLQNDEFPLPTQSELDGALCIAAIKGEFDVVKYLIKHGANPKAANGWVLYLIAENEHFEIIEFLKTHRTDLGEDNLTLWTSIIHREFEAIKFLVEYGGDMEKCLIDLKTKKQ